MLFKYNNAFNINKYVYKIRHLLIILKRVKNDVLHMLYIIKQYENISCYLLVITNKIMYL